MAKKRLYLHVRRKAAKAEPEARERNVRVPKGKKSRAKPPKGKGFVWRGIKFEKIGPNTWIWVAHIGKEHTEPTRGVTFELRRQHASGRGMVYQATINWTPVPGKLFFMGAATRRKRNDALAACVFDATVRLHQQAFVVRLLSGLHLMSEEKIEF